MPLIKLQGWAEQGGSVVIVSGLSSVPVDFQKSFPLSTITIHLTGTATLASLFQDDAGVTPQANPFTASATAYWSAYIAAGTYDITFSGAGISVPFTISAVTVGGSGGGGGGSEWGVYNPLDHGAVGDGSTDDTAAFTSILTLISTSTATIVFPFIQGSVSQYLVNSITFPSNVTLDFFPGGSLKPANGQTALIQGKVIAQPNQIFFNTGTIAAGKGVVSFGNTSAVNSVDGFTPQQKDYWAEWWGVVGDNVTHSADAFDAAFEALPSGSTMRLAGKFYYLEHGVTFGHKYACTLLGYDSDTALGSTNLVGSIFVYHGAAAGTVFTATNVYGCTFKGFGIYGSNGDGDLTHQAATNLLVTYTASGNPALTSHCYFDSLTLWALSSRTDWRGIFITNAGGNNEHHTIRECQFFGNDAFGTDQIAIDMAQSQVQRVIIERNNFSSVGICTSIQGNVLAYNNIYGSVGTVWQSIQANDNCVIIGDDAEQLVRVFDAPAVNGAVTISFMSCKYNGFVGVSQTALVVADAPIHMDAPVALSFYNCNFDNAFVTGQDFGPFFLGNEAGSQPNVEFTNCIIGTASDMSIYGQGFSTCHTIFRSGETDMRWGGRTGESIQLLKAAAPSMPSTRVLMEIAGPTNATQPDPLVFGGAYGVGGLFPVVPISLATVGTTGATTYRFTIIAVDAQGRRTALFTLVNTNHFLDTTIGNATLSGTNYINLTWFSQFPSPDHFEVWDVNPANAIQWRFVSNVTPVGTGVESYNVQANPAGAYVSTEPLFNEAGLINFRNVTLYPYETTFTDGDTTPSVAIVNDYVTANTTDKTITAFDGPTVGQVIRIRAGDTHTTIQNNSTIFTATGGDIKLVLGLVYSFVYRASAWHQIANVPASEVLLASVASVNMNTATASTLYTVATGKSVFITKIIISNASTSLTTASFSFGFNAATFNDVFSNASHTELTGSTLYTVIQSGSGAGKVGTSTQVLKVLMNTLQGGAATTTMDIFGYLF